MSIYGQFGVCVCVGGGQNQVFYSLKLFLKFSKIIINEEDHYFSLSGGI